MAFDYSTLTPEQKSQLDALPDYLKDTFQIDQNVAAGEKANQDKVDTAAATDRRNEYDAYTQSLVDYAKNNKDITVNTVGSDPNDPAVKSSYDAATKAGTDYKAALDNYTYQTQQLQQMAAQTPPTDPQALAAYKAEKAAREKAVATATATLDSTKQAAQTALNAYTTAKQQSVDPRYLSTGSTVAAPPDVTATTVQASPLNFTPGLVAQQIAPQQQVQAGNVWQPTGVTAQQIGAPSAVTAQMISAPTIAVDQIDKGAIKDISLDGTVGRQAQLDILKQLQDAAAGKTTSAAEWLLRKGVDENVSAAYGLAASLQGRNTGGALRAGTIAAKDAIAKSSADIAALRAKEQADARTAVATLGTAMSETDYKVLASNQTKDLTVEVQNLQARVNVAMKQAELAERAGEANQAASLNAQIATMNAQIDVAKANASNSLNADIATMTAKLDASKADTANKLQADITNSQNELERLKANQAKALEAQEHNQADALQVQITTTQQQLDAAKSNQMALLEAAKATAANILTASTETSKLTQANDQFNASTKLDVNKTNVTNQTAIDLQNKAIQMAVDQHASSALLSNVGIDQTDRTQDQKDAEIALQKQQIQNQEDAAYMDFIGSLLGTGAKTAASVYTGGK